MKPIRVQSKKAKTGLPDKIKRQPKRWLVNAYIYLLIFLNGMMVLMTFLAMTYLGQEKVPNPTLHSPTIYASALIVSIINIFCLMNILKMQRWAFWGYCFCIIPTIGLQIAVAVSTKSAVTNILLGLANPLILYCLLAMGGRRSMWHEMSNKPLR